MRLTFNSPLNGVSFGQVSTALLRELYSRKENDGLLIALIGDKADLSSQEKDDGFFEWVGQRIDDYNPFHSRTFPTFRLWHLQGSMGWISDNQALMSFYELDDPTPTELNIAKNNRRLVFTSQYSCDLFKSRSVDATYIPLGFDSHNFRVTDKKYFDDDRIVFNLCGKFEFRKHHAKILKAWAKKFGNDRKYYLQCTVYNSFLNAEVNNSLVSSALGGNRFFNINFLPPQEKNASYNDFLNSADIIIGMSGGEGWGLPEFQSVALGKHGVILDAHGYKGWASEKNATLVPSSGKVDCVDNVFFKKGEQYNQGKIYTWDEDNFISACEEAIKKRESSSVNEEGLKLQQEFTYSKTLDKILEVF